MAAREEAHRSHGEAAIPPVLVFVGGLHRSGTSLVHRCLASHPEVSGFSDTGVPEDEGQHLQTVYPPDFRLGGAGRVAVERGAERSALATAQSRARLVAEWGPTAARRRRRRREVAAEPGADALSAGALPERRLCDRAAPPRRRGGRNPEGA
ncbi:MAG: sulfotransferase [Gaiellales bacterium]